MENNFSTSLLADMRLAPGGLDIDVRLPWYRSMPLSIVEVARLAIDGRPIPSTDIRLEINGRVFALHELPELTGEFWYVLDAAVLHATVKLDATPDHTIALQLNLYPPYIPGLTWVTNAARTVRVQ